uniref:ABC-2 type transporter transmembrane domain-containing protein n=1 Tax=Glossina brevipalpis TaxID=37001 RepID=A0A1A9WJ61_9MUSC
MSDHNAAGYTPYMFMKISMMGCSRTCIWPHIVFSSVYVLVAYCLTSQAMEVHRVTTFVVVCVLTSLVAQSLDLLIGAGINIETRVFREQVTTILIILFSGFFVNFDTIPSYHVSYVRYRFADALFLPADSTVFAYFG